MAEVTGKVRRPMYEELRPAQPIHAPRGTERTCATWDAEAITSMSRGERSFGWDVKNRTRSIRRWPSAC